MCKFEQLQRIYNSMNIYHAFYIIDDLTKEDMILLDQIKEEGYPIYDWYFGFDFVGKARILIIRQYDLVNFRDDMDLFTVGFTTDEKVFYDCMNDPLCSNLILVKL